MKPAAVTSAAEALDSLSEIPLEHLQRGKYQPRVDMRKDTIEELARSMQAQGVLQPVVVRPVGESGGEKRFEIIAGERRWRAAQMAGLETIPAVIKDVPDEAAIAMSIIENIQREDLNPLEEARGIQRLISEFRLTHQAAAEAVGRSRATVSNLIRLTELSDKVKGLLEARELDMGHARALLAIGNPADQYEAARQVMRNGLSVRATEQLVRKILSGTKKKTTHAKSKDKDIQRLEMDLTDKLGAKVRIDHTAKGSGKVTIGYNSLDELDGILKHIQ